MSTQLTKRQSAVLKLLKSGCIIRPSKRINSKKCYRLLSHDFTPISYINPRTIIALVNKKRIIQKNTEYVISRSKEDSRQYLQSTITMD
jgi:hypothetical protein